MFYYIYPFLHYFYYYLQIYKFIQKLTVQKELIKKYPLNQRDKLVK